MQVEVEPQRERNVQVKEDPQIKRNAQVERDPQIERNVQVEGEPRTKIDLFIQEPPHLELRDIRRKKQSKLVIIKSEELDGNIYSLVETEDKRIASGDSNGNISISSYDINEKTWNRNIHKMRAHNKWVKSLCTLNGNRLLSGSSDCLIKLWSISDEDLTLIKEIKGHTDWVNKVIPLTKERFASCSVDKTVKIWKDDKTYKCIFTLQADDEIMSILQLRGKEVLVSSCGTDSSPRVSFWDITKYINKHTIKGYGVKEPTHMIELLNGNIALSSKGDEYSYPIVIINTSSYQIIKRIDCNLDDMSSMCMFDEHSFIYIHYFKLLQISSKDYSILFESTNGHFGGHHSGVIPLEGGKYFAFGEGGRIMIITSSFV